MYSLQQQARSNQQATLEQQSVKLRGGGGSSSTTGNGSETDPSSSSPPKKLKKDWRAGWWRTKDGKAPAPWRMAPQKKGPIAYVKAKDSGFFGPVAIGLHKDMAVHERVVEKGQKLPERKDGKFKRRKGTFLYELLDGEEAKAKEEKEKDKAEEE